MIVNIINFIRKYINIKTINSNKLYKINFTNKFSFQYVISKNNCTIIYNHYNNLFKIKFEDQLKKRGYILDTDQAYPITGK